ncbi:hypothetical protein KY318_02800, partial [Candidatus Woesearchaeota archaeon]|nr:hypothetical protein [Candidatus Woesearchaeota archaeon]
SDSDVIISCEPTLAWVGKIIKEELIRPKERLSYSGVTIAHAFALDREILYRRVIIPALEQGKIIFQERGVITSFVYQPVQIHTPLTELMNIPGNKLALKYAPSLIIICTVEPEYLMPRLEKRPSHDRQIFEHLSFQRKLYHRYKSDWLRELFAKYGSTFAYIDTNPPKTEEDTILAAKKVWEDYLAKL